MTPATPSPQDEEALTLFLNSILQSPSTGLTTTHLATLSKDHLVDYSLLLFALLGKSDNRDLLDAFLSRVETNRELKLRVAIMIALGPMKDEWNLQLKFKRMQMSGAEEEEGERKDPPPSSPPLKPITASELLLEEAAFTDYVKYRFFHPTKGIQLKTKKRTIGLRIYNNAFSKQYALLWLMQDLNCDLSSAQKIFQKMQDENFLKVLAKGTEPSHTGLGNDVYTYTKFINLVGSMPGKNASTVAPTEANLTMDSLDLQSLRFWVTTLWEKPPLEGSHYNASVIVHPLTGDWVHDVGVEKVYASMAKPAFLSLNAYKEGSIIGTDGSMEEVMPRVIAKNGDNLLNDASVELLFRIFTHVWKNDSTFGDGDAPLAYDYDVLPCGPRVGLLQVLDGLEPLNDFDWSQWSKKYKDNAEVKHQMYRSAAGCSIAAYIIGCGDRHWDNIQIQNDTTLLHIDFGMILGENPAFKTPRFSISAGQEKAFKEVGIWEDFIALSGQAFLSLRNQAPALMNLTALVLHHAGRSQSKVLKYLASKESFYLSEADDAKVVERVTQQIKDSSTDWETIARKFTHDRIDPLFFKAVEKAPAGLVAAVEKLYDKT